NIRSINLKPTSVNAYLKPDVLVMYDFELQTFKDVNGDSVYPVFYNNSAYLPVRAISQLMKEPIEWDGVSKTVIIGDGEEANTEENTSNQEISQAAKTLKSLFEREEILYYEATSKTTGLKTATSLNEKQLLATEISDNYLSAESLTSEIKGINTSGYTEEQMIAYDKTVSFAESTEYYILVLENIAYLAASDTDYSMLAETFLYFAMDSQMKMEDARASIESIK
ncbi:MAG: hypothetical protein AAGU14_10600, partial [Eubacteriaceae bacterium]